MLFFDSGFLLKIRTSDIWQAGPMCLCSPHYSPFLNRISRVLRGISDTLSLSHFEPSLLLLACPFRRRQAPFNNSKAQQEASHKNENKNENTKNTRL